MAGSIVAAGVWMSLDRPLRFGDAAMRSVAEGGAPRQATQTPGASATPGPGETATPEAPGDAPLGLAWGRTLDGDARFVEVDANARAWFRLADPGGGEDGVAVASLRRPVQQWADLETVVEDRHEEVLRLGTLRDFFAVDPAARRVWVGARYWVDGSWTTVSRDPSGVGGGLRHASRAVLDGESRAGVPWQAVVDCPTPGGCVEHGLDRFTAEGEIDAEIRFEPAPGAERDELLASHLLPLLDQTGQAWVVGRRAMVPLADLEAPLAYPPLADENGAPNAGYVTAATRRPDGAPLVFLWVERRDRPTLVHELSAIAWVADGWVEALPADVLTAAPFLSGDPSFDRVVAAAFDEAGRLWLAGNTGGVGVWSMEEQAWLARWSAAELGLPPDARIRDLAVGADGAVWLATSAGAWAGARPVVGTLYLPIVLVP
jgi:hypothetical protein